MVTKLEVSLAIVFGGLNLLILVGKSTASGLSRKLNGPQLQCVASHLQ